MVALKLGSDAAAQEERGGQGVSQSLNQRHHGEGGEVGSSRCC